MDFIEKAYEAGRDIAFGLRGLAQNISPAHLEEAEAHLRDGVREFLLFLVNLKYA